jgi:predicted Zn-ribbon and HTH transcriptional regulator
MRNAELKWTAVVVNFQYTTRFPAFAIQSIFFTSLYKMQTVRQQIIALLNEAEMDARQLSGQVGIQEKEVVEHLSHISRSLAAKGRKLVIQPSECLQCGYVFKDRKRFTRPGRCPQCKKSHLKNPAFYIR